MPQQGALSLKIATDYGTNSHYWLISMPVIVCNFALEKRKKCSIKYHTQINVSQQISFSFRINDFPFSGTSLSNHPRLHKPE